MSFTNRHFVSSNQAHAAKIVTKTSIIMETKDCDTSYVWLVFGGPLMALFTGVRYLTSDCK